MILFIDDSTPGGGGSGSTTTWSPTDKSSVVTLSNANMTATFPNDGNTKGIRATTGKSAGKWYWELNVNSLGSDSSNTLVGFKLASQNLIINSAGTVSWAPSQQVRENTTQVNGDASSDWAAGNVLMLAMDVDALKVWVGVNGTWAFSGNPAAGTNQAANLPSAGTWHPWALLNDFVAGCAFTINCGATAFTYTPPSGFSAI